MKSRWKKYIFAYVYPHLNISIFFLYILTSFLRSIKHQMTRLNFG